MPVASEQRKVPAAIGSGQVLPRRGAALCEARSSLLLEIGDGDLRVSNTCAILEIGGAGITAKAFQHVEDGTRLLERIGHALVVPAARRERGGRIGPAGQQINQAGKVEG